MIPVIDVGGDIGSISTELVAAIESIGFVYLINCGIDIDKVERLINLADQFWKLPQSIKDKYKRPTDYDAGGNTGSD